MFFGVMLFILAVIMTLLALVGRGPWEEAPGRRPLGIALSLQDCDKTFVVLLSSTVAGSMHVVCVPLTFFMNNFCFGHLIVFESWTFTLFAGVLLFTHHTYRLSCCSLEIGI